MKQRQSATFSERWPGVDNIDFDVDNGKEASEATVTARTWRWQFPPGAVVILQHCGPANGRWLVESVSRGIFDASATITLKRVTEPLPEPAPETETASTDAGGSFTGTSSANFGGDTTAAGAANIAQGTPREIIDTVVIPIARRHNMVTGVDAGAIAAANARHGSTVTGSRSDHQGPPTVAWASDMSNGSNPTPQMDAVAAEIARTFGIAWTGSGLVNRTNAGYRYQLIYRTNSPSTGGNHMNHVHFGVRRA
jgi:hypothetical protein